MKVKEMFLKKNELCPKVLGLHATNDFNSMTDKVNIDLRQ